MEQTLLLSPNTHSYMSSFLSEPPLCSSFHASSTQPRASGEALPHPCSGVIPTVAWFISANHSHPITLAWDCIRAGTWSLGIRYRRHSALGLLRNVSSLLIKRYETVSFPSEGNSQGHQSHLKTRRDNSLKMKQVLRAEQRVGKIWILGDITKSQN